MALRKPVELESGVVADYWRIIEIHHNFRDGATRVLLQLYLSHDARGAGKQPLPVYEQVVFTKDDNPFGNPDDDGSTSEIDALLAKLYEHIKSVAQKSVQNKSQGLEHLRTGSERVLEKFADAEDI